MKDSRMVLVEQLQDKLYTTRYYLIYLLLNQLPLCQITPFNNPEVPN